MGAPRIARLRALSSTDTGRAAELGVAAMVGNVVAVGGAAVAARGRHVLASEIAVRDVPWGAAATVPAASLWLILSVERGALLGFQRYRLVGVSIVAEQTARLVFGVILAVAGLDV